MNTKNTSKEIQLPSTKKLMQSTAMALVTALFLLVTVVLPAEYGIDPTGFGRILGLTEMGEIKNNLAKEAEQDKKNSAAENSQAAPKELESQDTPSKGTTPEAVQSEVKTILLKPGEAAEIKLSMKKGDIVTYKWSTDTGHVNYDTHGDNSEIGYHGYAKGKTVVKDTGKLQAAFDGKHGWFWRNRSGKNVTVTLRVSGNYSGIHRVL